MFSPKTKARETWNSEQINYLKKTYYFTTAYLPLLRGPLIFFKQSTRFLSHVCVTPMRSRISRQGNNTLHIDWQDQCKREIFKNFQERDNNYRNIGLSPSRAALANTRWAGLPVLRFIRLWYHSAFCVLCKRRSIFYNNDSQVSWLSNIEIKVYLIVKENEFSR